MALTVDIRKKLGKFRLDVRFRSTSRRIGILGASGSGKSMTLKCIAGIEQPDEGRIESDGKVFYDSREKTVWKPQKRNIGYLFQNYALFPTMTVEKNIAAGLKGSRQEKEARVREMIQKFRLQGLENHLPGELSGGQQQRTALARILAYRPEMLLLDEPFSALDMHLKDQLERELSEMLEDYPGTVILVSHSRDEVYRFSRELLVLDRGQIAAAGETKELFRNPVSCEAARLTGCKNLTKVRRIDSHTVEAPDWGLTLHLKREVPEWTAWLGYRAHDFIPVWDGQTDEKERNRIPCEPESVAELPFEKNYYIRTKTGGKICWFVQREQLRGMEEKGMPDALAFAEEKILFLK
ncbi:MAG TPA: ATP-binding cassette domain-containing protein [Candidatus Mediterraneibacter merdipullorum]|nr:ATP-binding cassette domain-containing protein [Candidatus Mediterraneibacter merdipullorum]